MYIEWLFFFIPIWIVSAGYVIYFDYKREYLSIPNVILAIIMGPILTSLIIDDKLKTKKHQKEFEERESESNERHRRWFRTMGEINRERRHSWYRSIPPPPPISRVERARTERDEAIRSAIERIDKNKLKDFKFLRNNTKDKNII
jgi:hypothetical protein